MMHEDRLYNQFKSQLENYAPDVPAAVYSGMRRKLWLSQFLKFNATSLNAWYVGTALIVGIGVWLSTSQTPSTAQQAVQHSSEITFLPEVATSGAVSAVTCSSAPCEAKKHNTSSCGLSFFSKTQPEVETTTTVDQVTTDTPQAADVAGSDQMPTVEQTADVIPQEVAPQQEVAPKTAKKTKRRDYNVKRY